MKIYVLSLIVDQRNGPGSTIESQWISTSKEEIEKKKETEWKNLLSYFDISSSLIRELENSGDICYYNRDLDSFPRLIIKEVKVTKEVKQF